MAIIAYLCNQISFTLFNNLNIFGGSNFRFMVVKSRIFFLLILIFITGCNPPSNQAPREIQFPAPEEPVANAVPPLPDARIARIDSILTKVLQNYRYNGNALVAIKGYPVFEYSNGYADLYQKTPLDFNTVFQIASVSKGFTAMSVLMLCEQGKIGLDDSVKTHIPEFPFDNITTRQLLAHTSGLQNYMYFVDHYWEKGKPINNEDVLTLINDHNPQLNFRPGSRHLYNNTGYAILALLVERVSGKRFSQFVKDEIFDPLEMNHTFAWNKAVTDTIVNIATGFTRRGWRYRKFAHNPLDEVLGDKSIYSTADDMLKWDQALYTNKLLSDTLLKAAFSKIKTSRGREHKYGFGWRLDETDGKKVIYHNGLWNGFTATLTRYVDDELTIILLNNTNAPVASIVRQFYGILKKEAGFDKKTAQSN
jgi:CubicO group peptidase (beta-lactamase class C family)